MVPDKETVEVEIGPFLGLPPVVLFALVGLVLHGAGRGGLGDGLEEDGAPGNVGVGDAEGGREFELEVC